MDDYPTSELWVGNLLEEIGPEDVKAVLGRWAPFLPTPIIQNRHAKLWLLHRLNQPAVLTH